MGYCHNWGRPMEVSPEIFSSYVEEVKKLRRAIRPTFWFFGGGIKITGAMGWGPPEFKSEIINFNGRPMCENFLITRNYSTKYKDPSPNDDGLFWDYVKTNERPYDVLVTAALLSFRHHVPEVLIESSGDRDDWQKGIALYERVTQRKVPEDFLK